ncbi:MAG TPA: universal stress protein, partial [Acidimicrobiales bacterium]
MGGRPRRRAPGAFVSPSGHVPLSPDHYARSRRSRLAGDDVWRDTLREEHDQPSDAVVVGFDGSEAATAAAEWAAAQAARTGERLELVSAWEYPTSWGNV